MQESREITRAFANRGKAVWGIVKGDPARPLHKRTQVDLNSLGDQGKVFTAQKVKRKRAEG